MAAVDASAAPVRKVTVCPSAVLTAIKDDRSYAGTSGSATITMACSA
jgi:hypothetical protein